MQPDQLVRASVLTNTFCCVIRTVQMACPWRRRTVDVISTACWGFRTWFRGCHYGFLPEFRWKFGKLNPFLLWKSKTSHLSFVFSSFSIGKNHEMFRPRVNFQVAVRVWPVQFLKEQGASEWLGRQEENKLTHRRGMELIRNLHKLAVFLFCQASRQLANFLH